MQVCPQCGNEATYIMVRGYTIAACASCAQATVFEANKIIQIKPSKLDPYVSVRRQLLMIALTSQALFENWEIITHPTQHM